MSYRRDRPPTRSGPPARSGPADRRVVRARGPADLLALVPGLIGFHPESSVVVLTVGGAAQPFHARVDLPEDPVGVEVLARHLADIAARNGVTRLACVLYTDDAGLAEAFGAELDGRLQDGGTDLVCVVRADGRRWWPVGGGHPGSAAGDPDHPGTAYDVDAHPLMAQAVLDGTVVLRSRQELADTLVGDDADEVVLVSELGDAAVAGLVHALDERRGRDALRLRLEGEGRWVRQRVRGFLDGDDGDGDEGGQGDQGRLDAQDVARLAALVTLSVEVRDVAWAEMSHADAGRHVDLWRDVVRRVPVHLRAAPAALLGFAAWLSGDGALAWCAVECAQEAEPAYSLALLLADALAGAVPPSTWQPIPQEALTLFSG
jgi:hypothetical protein